MKIRHFLSVPAAGLLLAALLLLGACGKQPAESTPAPSQTENAAKTEAVTTAPTEVPTAAPTEAPTEPQTEPADEGPDDVPLTIEPAGDVIDKYTKDEADHASRPLTDLKER